MNKKIYAHFLLLGFILSNYIFADEDFDSKSTLNNSNHFDSQVDKTKDDVCVLYPAHPRSIAETAIDKDGDLDISDNNCLDGGDTNSTLSTSTQINTVSENKTTCDNAVESFMNSANSSSIMYNFKKISLENEQCKSKVTVAINIGGHVVAHTYYLGWKSTEPFDLKTSVNLGRNNFMNKMINCRVDYNKVAQLLLDYNKENHDMGYELGSLDSVEVKKRSCLIPILINMGNGRSENKKLTWEIGTPPEKVLDFMYSFKKGNFHNLSNRHKCQLKGNDLLMTSNHC